MRKYSATEISFERSAERGAGIGPVGMMHCDAETRNSMCTEPIVT